MVLYYYRPDAPHLDGRYVSFGMVNDGMDIDAIVNTKRLFFDLRPREEQKMHEVRYRDGGSRR